MRELGAAESAGYAGGGGGGGGGGDRRVVTSSTASDRCSEAGGVAGVVLSIPCSTEPTSGAPLFSTSIRSASELFDEASSDPSSCSWDCHASLYSSQ